MIPASARVAVYSAPGASFELQDHPLRQPHADEVPVRISMATL